MDKRRIQDPETARFYRKHHKDEGVDEQQQHEDINFYADPSKAINKHAKQRTQRNLQKQVEYFGNAIEPFHMRQQQQLGEIDEQGFFVFNRKNRVRDAWLDSIGEADDAEIADQLAKKIKTESRFQSVYEAGEQLNKDLQQNQQQEQEQYEGGGIEEVSQSQQSSHSGKKQQNGLTTGQLIQIMIELIPENSNANNYMKKLKIQKKMEEYNKLLAISNEYIEKTGQYDILTKKREDLEEVLDQINEKERKKKEYEQAKKLEIEREGEEEPIMNWDDQQSGNKNSKDQIKQSKQDKKNAKKKNKEEASDQQQEQSHRRGRKKVVQQNQSSAESEEDNEQDNQNVD